MITIILVIILVIILIILSVASRTMIHKASVRRSEEEKIEGFWYYPNCLSTLFSGVRCYPPYGYAPFREWSDPSNIYTDYLY